MKKILLLFTAISFAASAQTPSLKNTPPLTEAKPASAGISAERLNRISDMIQQAVNDNVIPGAVALVARNGKIVYHKAFGESDVEKGKAFEKNSIFRIASQSKAITTTAAMMLWEEGKFRLDDPVSKYIPEFANPQVLDRFRMADSSFTTKPAGKEITIRNLITHTSGLGYGVIDGDERFKAIYAKAGITDLFTTEPVTIEESVKKLAKLPLHHVPGEKFTYSEGLDVLGYLIEIWSGQSFDEYLKLHIFEPLNMQDTFFYLPVAKSDRLVEVQTKDKDGNWVHFTDAFYDVNYPKTGAKSFFSGGAGLSSTAKDYAIFLNMYLNQGETNGVRLLSRKTVEFMLSNQIGELFGNHAGFGLGYEVLNANGAAMGGLGSEGTFRWGGYFNTQYFADPKEKVIGIIMKQTQRVGGDYTGDMFRQLVFQTIDD
ncbi:serine hydrolase domain-containing protein [Jiulongibacter sediminis]|uniref:Beta-lactamase n=1 Tax=Jiulongibacter sediminis TaxID=1605367 RepID=A0A0P7BP20_9BACT|nr:serine hydrolase domain-containing protein [Jiulongibacter sediminis]KPM48955.1 beta-lactamase [Jiulongibacter sediminis]TBX25481.1 beta-lactamase [Jiulongibacter sediminis]